MTELATPVLRAVGLAHQFPVPGNWGRRRWYWAVAGIDLSIHRGRAVGLVGESGSGKTTLARALLRLIRPTRGRVWFDEIELTHLSVAQLAPLRRRMQIVFQDPATALNPRLTVGQMLGEPLTVHRLGAPSEVPGRIDQLLDRVGLVPEMAYRYPHQLSGGERQRVGIARALSVAPEMIVADEPVSALDVSVQAQILNLLAELRQCLGLTLLLISHDLQVVRLMCDELWVMYLGRIVERGPADRVFCAPAHPYTQLLLAATRQEPGTGETHVACEPGSIMAPPPGCVFHPRCAWAEDRCRKEAPPLRRLTADREVACHLAEGSSI